MKKIFLYFSLMAIIFLYSRCNKSYIQQPVYGVTSNANFYTSDTAISEALTGTYLQLHPFENEYSLYHFFTGDITTDDAYKGGANDADVADLQYLSTFSGIVSTNSIASTMWGQLYGVINRANEVIFYTPGVKNGNADVLNRYVLEAKGLRAFCYYELVTLYGKVPLVLQPLSTSQVVNTPRASTDSVFAQIISDLTAATALPTKSAYADADKYRVSQGFAYAMLGKTYMFQGNFSAAAAALKNVIQSNVYSLLPNYGDNWKIFNSNESIFEISNQMTANVQIETGSQIPMWFMCRNTINYQGYVFNDPEPDLFNEFDADDPRIPFVFTMNGDTFKGDVAAQDNSDAPTGYHDRKALVPYYERTAYTTTSLTYNVRWIRYSDILLLYAEAENELGDGGDALTYLNQVRARARNSTPIDVDRSVQVYIPATNPATTLPDVTTTDQAALRTAIWHERRCELAEEGWRRDDLCRQKRFGTVMRAFAAKYATNKGQGFDDNRDYLLPVPETEIQYSNGVITQNPGF